MSEEMKKQEFLDYLEENVWREAERVGIENNDRRLIHGVRITRVRISQLPTVRKMLNFFWNAVEGTERSINFSDIMKAYGLTRFEDLIEDVRVRFNDDWIRG